MLDFLKKWLIKREIRKAGMKSNTEKIADDVLKDAIKELQQTSRTSNKLLQAKLIRQETQHALGQINDLDEDLDQGDQDQEQSPQDILIAGLMTKLLSGGSQQPQQTGEIQGYDDEGKPVYAQTQQPAPASPSIADITKKLSPEDINALKDKFLK